MSANGVKHVGRSVVSRTNAQLVAGKGTYVDDVQLPGMTHMAVLRSPHAHARIRSIDTRVAQALPGVVYVITGDEVVANMRPIPETWDTSAIGARAVTWYPLVADRVRFVGEAVAAVVAEDKHTAHRALSLIEVDYEPLPVVANARDALRPDSPLVEPEWGDNVVITREFLVGDVDRAFAEAEHSITGVAHSNRVTGVAIEPRGSVASYDAYADQLTYWDSGQNPHPLRVYLAETLQIPEKTIRVIQPHVGGAFGLKQPTFQEQPLVAYLARKLRRPVKWIEERVENLQAGGHAREMELQYDAAFTSDGRVTGLRVNVITDVGAPTALVGWGMSVTTATTLPTLYNIPHSQVQLRAVVTNKCPWNSYRGFGKDGAAFLMDRVLDRVAKVTGLDRAEVRFRNFIQPEQFPFSRPSGALMDSGDYPSTLKRLLEIIDYGHFPEAQAQARAEGRFIGLGLGTELTPEGCAMPGSMMISGYDGATVRVSPSGQVTVLSGVTSPGNGNETALAQIAADALGCPFENVRVVQGDTDTCPWGLGNYSSRSVMVGGGAIRLAAGDLRDKMLTVAGRMLESAVDDLEVADGTISLKGVASRTVGFNEVASYIYRHPFGEYADDLEPALEATRYYRSENVYHQREKYGRFNQYPTWSNAAAACLVEVDPETGMVKVLRHWLVDDAGVIVNPVLAEANLHGGIAQGLGGGLYERLAYDTNGQLQTATLMDYTLPTAIDLPPLDVVHHETPSPFTPLGTKGVGESGVGSALGALCSAIEDALPHLDLQLERLPLTPITIWRAIQAVGHNPN